MTTVRRRRKRPRAQKQGRPQVTLSPAELAAAEREAVRNKARIEAGETFAGHKPSAWRIGGKRKEPGR